MLGVKPGGVGDDASFPGEEVLVRHGRAEQRHLAPPVGGERVERAGARQRAVSIQHDEAVQRGLQPLGARERGFDQVAHRQFAALEPRHLVDQRAVEHLLNSAAHGDTSSLGLSGVRALAKFAG